MGKYYGGEKVTESEKEEGYTLGLLTGVSTALILMSLCMVVFSLLLRLPSPYQEAGVLAAIGVLLPIIMPAFHKIEKKVRAFFEKQEGA
jgi:hypothetical protein